MTLFFFSWPSMTSWNFTRSVNRNLDGRPVFSSCSAIIYRHFPHRKLFKCSRSVAALPLSIFCLASCSSFFFLRSAIAARCIRGIRFLLLAKHFLPSLGSVEILVTWVWLHGETTSRLSSFGYRLKKIVFMLRSPVYLSNIGPVILRSTMISSSDSFGVSAGIIPLTMILARASLLALSRRSL